MSRGRSRSPRAANDADVDMDVSPDKLDARVIIVTNLTRNVVESHLRTIFGFYGHITKLDLPVFLKSGQNKGKAALEFSTSPEAHKAASHMDGGQLDGATVKVELSDLPIRSPSRSPVRPPPRGPRNARDKYRSFSRSRSRSRSRSPRSRSRSPPPHINRRRGPGDSYGGRDRDRDSFRGRPYGRRGPPGRDVYRPRTRSRSPIRRVLGGRLPPRRRSPSYERGGYPNRRSRSRSSSVRSSRSRTRSRTASRSRSRSRSPRSRSRSRARSYSSGSRYSRSRSRTRSLSRDRKRSRSRDDIRDSRSRSPAP